MNKVGDPQEVTPPTWSSSELIQALTDNVRIFLFAYSPKRRAMNSWSANALQVLGVKDCVIANHGNLFLQHVHADDRFLLMTDLENALQGKREYRATYRWVRPDNNELRWLHCRAALVSSGDEPLFEGLIVDISDEITGAVSSFAGPDSLGAVLAAFSATVFVLDTNLRLVRINRAKDGQTFKFGDKRFKTRQFRIGRPLLACFTDPAQKTNFEEKFQAVLRGDLPFYRSRIFESEVVFNIEAAPLSEHGVVRGLLVNVSDITEIVRLERQLADLQKREGLRLIAAGVTHNFNNCLQGIIGHAAVIERHSDKPELVKAASEAIIEIVNRASELSKQLYKLGSPTAEYVAPTDLNLAVMAAVSRMEDLFAAGTKVAVAFGSPAPVIGKQEDLTAAIAAVLQNAKEHLNEGGGITVRTCETDLEELEVEDLKTGRYAKLIISDTGAGMPPETKQRCLEPFYTTQDRDPHTGVGLKKYGLGLSGAHATLRNLGGALTIESTLGVGTTVSMYLPLLAPAAGKAEVKTLQPAAAPEILVIDDDHIVLDTTAAILKDLGYACITADNQSSAMSLLKKHARSLRLVLLDALMPGTNSPALLQRMKKLKRELVVVGFSGAAPETTQTLLDAGAASILRKPVGIEELKGLLRDVLGQKAAA